MDIQFRIFKTGFNQDTSSCSTDLFKIMSNAGNNCVLSCATMYAFFIIMFGSDFCKAGPVLSHVQCQLIITRKRSFRAELCSPWTDS